MALSHRTETGSVSSVVLDTSKRAKQLTLTLRRLQFWQPRRDLQWLLRASLRVYGVIDGPMVELYLILSQINYTFTTRNG